MPFPSPPWTLRGDLWLSVFVVGSGGTSYRPRGLYAAAFVDYREGSVLTYRELLVARVLREGASPGMRITDIWVDSPESRDGGRALWAVPKELADLGMRERDVGPARQTFWDASIDGSAVASVHATGVRAPVLRTPFRFGVSQQREDGTTVVAGVSGSAETMPWLVRWDFAADGPLAWLRGHRPVLSLRAHDFRLRFGD